MIGRGAFIVNDTSVSGHPGCATVMAVIRDNLEMRGLSLTGRWPMGVEPHLGLASSAALRKAAVVLVNGEGTLHHTAARPGARRLLQAVKRVRQATAAPLILLNATIEHLRPRDFDILKSCDAVFLRDQQSCRYAAANGLAARFAPDLCMAAQHEGQPRLGHLAVTDSTLPEATTLLRRLASAAGAQYLPMQPPRLSSMMHWAVLPRGHEHAARRYFAALSSAGRLLTGRFHAAVFALVSETPFLALASNTSKIQSLLKDALGGDARIVTPQMLSQGGLLVPPFSEEELSRLRAYRAGAVAQAQSMFDHIAQAAAQGAARGA